jgi:predicted kinase
MVDGGKYSKGNERFIETLRDLMINAALSEGRHVIVDDTNLNPRHEEVIRELVNTWNAGHNDNVVVEVKSFLDISVDECIERDKKRTNSVGADVIVKMARQWLPKWELCVPELDIKNQRENGLPWCVIYDLDGTAAIMGDRSPYDASECDKVDRPNHPLLEILMHLEDADYNLIALSGRTSKYRDATERFLDKHGFPCDALYMRAEGDSRKDAIIKGELYEEHIKGKFNVLVVFDDRDQMVDFWRKDAGLPCFQVNYGDF